MLDAKAIATLAPSFRGKLIQPLFRVNQNIRPAA